MTEEWIFKTKAKKEEEERKTTFKWKISNGKNKYRKQKRDIREHI